MRVSTVRELWKKMGVPDLESGTPLLLRIEVAISRKDVAGIAGFVASEGVDILFDYRSLRNSLRDLSYRAFLGDEIFGKVFDALDTVDELIDGEV